MNSGEKEVENVQQNRENNAAEIIHAYFLFSPVTYKKTGYFPCPPVLSHGLCGFFLLISTPAKTNKPTRNFLPQLKTNRGNGKKKKKKKKPQFFFCFVHSTLAPLNSNSKVKKR
jgi:hypothetical protein